MFCPECGIDHHAPVTEPEAAVDAVAEITNADVEIARIQADRDIKLARIGAGAIDVELETGLAREQGKVEGMETVIEAAAPDPEPAGDPIIVDAPTPEPEPVLDAPPPPPAEPVEKKSSKPGYWDAYA